MDPQKNSQLSGSGVLHHPAQVPIIQGEQEGQSGNAYLVAAEEKKVQEVASSLGIHSEGTAGARVLYGLPDDFVHRVKIRCYLFALDYFTPSWRDGLQL